MVSNNIVNEMLWGLAAPVFVGSLLGVFYISTVSEGKAIYSGKIDNTNVEYREEAWTSFLPIGDGGKQNIMRVSTGGTRYLLFDARNERSLDSLRGVLSSDTLEEVVIMQAGKEEKHNQGKIMKNGSDLYNSIRDKIIDELKRERGLIEYGP